MRSVGGRTLWLLTGALAVLAAAQWLRTPSVPYLVASSVATAATVGAALAFRTRRRWVAGFAVAMTAFAVASAVAQRSVARIDREWDAYRADIEFGAAERLERAMLSTATELTAAANRALDVPADTAAFEALEPLVRGAGERGIVVFGADAPRRGRARRG